jgi:phage-related protein
MTNEKRIIWLGSTLKDLPALPEGVRREIGYVLDHVQRGEHHKSIKPLKGMGGVYEIRADLNKDTYRTVYALNLGDYLYVLHVFKKKSKSGIATPKEDGEVIRTRLKQAKEDLDARSKN